MSNVGQQHHVRVYRGQDGTVHAYTGCAGSEAQAETMTVDTLVSLPEGIVAECLAPRVWAYLEDMTA
jgi:hypothetical protein